MITKMKVQSSSGGDDDDDDDDEGDEGDHVTSVSLQGGAGLPGVRGDPVRMAGFTALCQMLCSVMQCDAV